MASPSPSGLSRWRSWFGGRLVDALELAFHHILRLLPIDVGSNLGAWAGRTFGPRKAGADRRLRRNLSILRPDIAAPDEIEAAVRRAWENAGRCMAEFSSLERMWRSDRVAVEGMDNLLAARAFGRPRIDLFLHLGNWELVGPKLLDLGEEGVQIAQPVRNPVRRRITDSVRQSYTDRLVQPGPGAARQIYRKLMSGGLLSIAVDEFVDGELYAPSFGRPLHFDGNLGRAVRFARRANAVMFIAYIVRDRGARFTLHILPPIAIDFTKFGEDEFQDAVRRLDEMIDPIVRSHIDQWFMLDNLRLD